MEAYSKKVEPPTTRRGQNGKPTKLRWILAASKGSRRKPAPIKLAKILNDKRGS